MSNAQSKAGPEPADPSPAAPELVEQLIRQGEAAGASDIHLQMRGPIAEVGFRLDGVITPAVTLPEDVADRVFGRIKYLARLKTYQDSLPQDGRINKQDVKSVQRHPRGDVSHGNRGEDRSAPVSDRSHQNRLATRIPAGRPGAIGAILSRKVPACSC